ncbi:hypothetical protein KIPB_008268 [Kipferlia bialata]|uniref:Uncharacterized protein n=1 Tax=Kipferlia bialata TaxID=797122 RepID=A0A9K3GGQ4_9EUKA|nr:hypothetical protein KIPB_003521 [Kipferlia bialata]GIQ86416.1 hypothetical protein KIPB_008268 [Kipferlia bialata]|eukprot:g3521.t1
MGHARRDRQLSDKDTTLSKLTGKSEVLSEHFTKDWIKSMAEAEQRFPWICWVATHNKEFDELPSEQQKKILEQAAKEEADWDLMKENRAR